MDITVEDAEERLKGKTPLDALVDMTTAKNPRPVVTVDIDGAMIEVDLLEQVLFNPDNLTEGMIDQAAKVTYWSVQVTKASRRVDRLKNELDIAEAKAAQAVRSGSVAATKVTEGVVKELTLLDPDVVRLKETLLHAQEVVGFLKAIVSGLRDRRDMIYLSGLLANAEMKMMGIHV